MDYLLRMGYEKKQDKEGKKCKTAINLLFHHRKNMCAVYSVFQLKGATYSLSTSDVKRKK